MLNVLVFTVFLRLVVNLLNLIKKPILIGFNQYYAHSKRLDLLHCNEEFFIAWQRVSKVATCVVAFTFKIGLGTSTYIYI